MRLPNAEQTVVPERKITHYLLSNSHREGQYKAVFFHSFGFRAEAWESLAAALRRHATSHDVAEIVETPCGRNFVIEGPLAAPDGREPKVRSVWFVARGEAIATLATA